MNNEIELGSKVKLRVKQHGKEEEFEGMFIESPDKSSVLIKLKTGYNIGFDKKDILDMKVIEKPKIIDNEKDFEQDKKLPGIAVIITGGTIASKVDYRTGGVYPVDDTSMFLANSPELAKIARINIFEIPFLTFSENLDFDHWKKLAKKVYELVNKPENKGVIILQGTDFLHYGAAALSFMLQDLGKPVALTFSQRSIDRGSSDAFLNLRCAFHATLSNIGEVMIVGHASTEDNFCYALRGTKVRKMHSSRRDAFKSVNALPLAKIYANGTVEKISEYRKRDENKKTKINVEFDDKVALVKYYPGMDPEILEHYVKKGYKGIVIEGAGFGHVATEGKNNWLSTLKKVCEKAVVCMTTQTVYGRVNPKVYSAGRMIEKTGVLYLQDMLSECAFVKLGCMLGREKDLENIKMLMLKNMAHEFSERLEE